MIVKTDCETVCSTTYWPGAGQLPEGSVAQLGRGARLPHAQTQHDRRGRARAGDRLAPVLPCCHPRPCVAGAATPRRAAQ